MKVCYTESDIHKVSKQLILEFKLPIWCFFAEMGSGKTTLIKSICQHLGVQTQVTSPTFNIVNQYSNDESEIYHFDFFRLKNIQEAIDLGIEEYLSSGHPCFIEWPDLILPLLNDPFLELVIKKTLHQKNKRTIIAKTYDPR